MNYVLVFWPYVQHLMEYDWFREESYLLNALEDQENYDSAYFVPKERIWELSEDVVRTLGLN
ncbi:MAG: hypothetical protein H0X33_14610 [Taibaiella sp.]|nr:hypothetical protein [Taibaiella sp.]